MATKIRKHTDTKKVIRFKRKLRIRSRVEGTSKQPRFSIFKSNSHIYAQLIDDETGATVIAASTLESELRVNLRNNMTGAKALGELIARRAKEKNIQRVVFDRSGYLYHGKIKAMADAARDAGLIF